MGVLRRNLLLLREFPRKSRTCIPEKFRLVDLENGVILRIMKSSLLSRTGFCVSAIIVVAVSGSLVLAQVTKEKAKPAAKSSAKPTASAKPSTKSGSKTPAVVDAKLNQHVAANMKLLGVLSRYAQTLSSAKDAATAHQAATKLEVVTKDAVSAGEALVKLGKPDPELEMKLASDADLKMTSQSVAEQTRAAVKTLASNAEVKTILAPAIESFQAALNRVQQAADEPQAVAETPAGAPDPNSPAPAPAPEPAPAPPPADNNKPATTAADTTEVPPPPPQ